MTGPKLPAGSSSEFEGVDALGPANVWVVGDYSPARHLDEYKGVISHWDGKTWSTWLSGSRFGGDVLLYGVAGTPRSGMWATGFALPKTRTLALTLRLHDGAWQQVSPESPPAWYSTMATTVSSVVATRSGDVWVAGSAYNRQGRSDALVEHWNGSALSIVPVRGFEGPRAHVQLLGIAAGEGGRVWAVGSSTTGGSAITWSWDGTRWAAHVLHNYPRGTSLAGVALAPGESANAVGWTAKDGRIVAIHPQWCGGQWREYCRG